MTLSDWYKRNKRSLSLAAAAFFLATTTSCSYINKSFNVNERKAMAPISQVKQDNRKNKDEQKQILPSESAKKTPALEEIARNVPKSKSEPKTKTYAYDCTFADSKGKKQEVTSIAQGLDKLVYDSGNKRVTQKSL